MYRITRSLIGIIFLITTSQEITPSSPAPLSDSTLSVTMASVQKPQSLFTEDTCAPPCWYGLNPGISTSEDVAAFFESMGKEMFCCLAIRHQSEFSSQLGNISNGNYLFYWKEMSRPNQNNRGNSGIEMFNGIVDHMDIVMNSSVYLGEATEKLGQPDRIRYDNLFIEPHLVLDYVDIPLRVMITGEQLCTMRDIEASFWVDRVEYYSPRYIEEFEWNAGYGDPELPDVPADVWEHWLNGGDDTPCNQVVDQLQALPTLTPTPIETSEAP